MNHTSFQTPHPYQTLEEPQMADALQEIRDSITHCIAFIYDERVLSAVYQKAHRLATKELTARRQVIGQEALDYILATLELPTPAPSSARSAQPTRKAAKRPARPARRSPGRKTARG
jgi:hypothetical protein